MNVKYNVILVGPSLHCLPNLSAISNLSFIFRPFFPQYFMSLFLNPTEFFCFVFFFPFPTYQKEGWGKGFFKNSFGTELMACEHQGGLQESVPSLSTASPLTAAHKSPPAQQWLCLSQDPHPGWTARQGSAECPEPTPGSPRAHIPQQGFTILT